MVLLAVLAGIGEARAGSADGRQPLKGYPTKAVMEPKAIGAVPPADEIHLSVVLPLRDRAQLDAFLRDVANPASSSYRKYLTPEKFAERFAPAEADHRKVIEWADANHLKVVRTFSNRTVIDLVGTAADVNRACGVTLEYAQRTDGSRFYRPDRQPSIELAVPVLAIEGLDDFQRPRVLSGSGLSNNYSASDLRRAYVPDTRLTGAGQSIGILAFDGYDPADIAQFQTRSGIPHVVPTNVLVNATGALISTTRNEATADIEMAMAMAPGIDHLTVYIGGTCNDAASLTNTMATTKPITTWQFSTSYICRSPGMYQAIAQMAADGQSFFVPSGDGGGYSPNSQFWGDSQTIVVGGTTLTMNGSGASWASEVPWDSGTQSSGGGVEYQIPIPPYQAGTTFAPGSGASTTQRNDPDVSMAASNIYIFFRGASGLNFQGTSASAPLWAGLMALVNQQNAANGIPPIWAGPALWNIGRNPTAYALAFHDIQTGTATSYYTGGVTHSAAVGYDLTTGWGTPNTGFIDQMACVACGVGGASVGTLGSCVNLQSDPNNYGTCGHQYVPPGTCASSLVPAPFVPAPDWFTTPNPDPVHHPLAASLFDTAWGGASQQDFSYGTAPHVVTRMGFVDDSGGNRDLYLQWAVFVDPASGGTQSGDLWLVLNSDDPLALFACSSNCNAHDTVLIHVRANATAVGEARTPALVEVYTKTTASGATWTLQPTPPTWLSGTARQWVSTNPAADKYNWGIALRVPLRAGQSSGNPSVGISPAASGKFTFAYELDLNTIGGVLPNVIAYTFPGNLTPLTQTAPLDPAWPNPRKLGTLQLDAACTPRVGITAADISTDQPDDHTLNRSGATVFRANVHLTGDPGAAATAVSAKFRIADWGSQTLGEFNAGDTPWLDVGTSLLQNLALPATPSALLATAPWTPPGGAAAWYANHNEHQCMYVELVGGGGSGGTFPNGILFSPASAWTNLERAPLSTFERQARISIQGLPPMAVPEPQRDVYLYLEPLNLEHGPRPKGEGSPAAAAPSALNTREVAPRAPAPDQAPDPSSDPFRPLLPLPPGEIARLSTPQYRVHVYHDTGLRRVGSNGQQAAILEPQGDFGYLIDHPDVSDATLFSHRTEVDPAARQGTAGEVKVVKLDEHYLRLSIDEGGFVTVKTTLTAEEPKTLGRWWWLLLLLVILALALLLWRRLMV